jgi:amidase
MGKMRRSNGEIDRRGFIQSAASLTAAIAMPSLAACRSATAALSDEPTALSASELSLAIKRRKVSCVEVMQSYLSRIERYNPVYNAIVSMLDPDDLLGQAALADRALDKGEYRGWLHGMPHAVKDLADAEGLETSYGSPIFAGTIADADELFVSRIRNQGAIFIGKTNTPEFGYGSQSYNPVHGTTRNAYDPDLTAGGSSGGAAVGLATSMLPAADGSDMMGSLRNPAAFNNVIGFRPSRGRVPEHPSSDLYYQQLAVTGPMGRNVEDTIRLLGTMAGYDARFPLSLRDSIPPYEQFKAKALEGLMIGWMRDYDGYLETEPGVLELCEQSLGLLSAHGAMVELCMPEYDMPRLWQTWLTLRHWSAGWARPLYDDPETRKLLKPEIIFEVEGSIDMPASRVSAAGIARADWYRALYKLFRRYDMLVLPSAQVFPFAADIHWPKTINDKEMDTYHRWMEVVIGATLAGLPVVNLPAGFDQKGRPMGMQFIGRSGEDVNVLEFARAYEAVTDYLSRRPDLVEAHG